MWLMGHRYHAPHHACMKNVDDGYVAAVERREREKLFRVSEGRLCSGELRISPKREVEAVVGL